MTLNLNIDKLAGPGRRAVPLEFSVDRELGDVDFGALATVDRGVVAPDLKRITDRHHALARLLAAGMSEGDAAMTLGYDNSRVSILKGSPAFQELLALYREEVNRESTHILDHMAGLSKDALLELRERIEDDPGKFSNRELLSITTDMVDRSLGKTEDGANKPVVIELVAPGDLPEDDATAGADE